MEDKDWQRTVDISKVDEDEHLVFGWLSVAVDKSGNEVVDLQDDIIPPEELEKAAYDYVLYARSADAMHSEVQIGHMVESMVFTAEKIAALGIPEGVLPQGWWVGYKIADKEAWEGVKSGKYTAFSIGGQSHREAAE